jgi:hypothetical protein
LKTSKFRKYDLKVGNLKIFQLSLEFKIYDSAVHLRTFQRDSPALLKNIPIKIPNVLFYRSFFLENALNFGVHRFFKAKIVACSYFGPKTDDQTIHNPEHRCQESKAFL